MIHKRLRSVIKRGDEFFLFLFTDNFRTRFRRLSSAGLRFVRPPEEKEYGTVAVFEDIYGNLWDLLETDGFKSLACKNLFMMRVLSQDTPQHRRVRRASIEWCRRELYKRIRT